MDDSNSTTLLEKEREKFKTFNTRRKQDGTLYRTRIEMKKDYDNTWLPYPLSAIIKLDYCRNIITSHVKQTFFFAIPISYVLSYAFNPEIRTKGMRSKPFVYYVSMYILVYSSMISFFMIDALIFCDYCKPWSPVYFERDRKDEYKAMLKSKIKQEQIKSDVQIKKTKDRGLSDYEL